MKCKKCEEASQRSIVRVLGTKQTDMPRDVFFDEDGNEHSLMPIFPEEVILSKARRLIARGLLTGCDCGCRGDFELTEAGREAIRSAGFELHQDGPAAAERLGLERQLVHVDWTTARYEVLGIEGSTLKVRLVYQTTKP